MFEKSFRHYTAIFFVMAATCFFAPQAMADRYYDYSTGTWVNYDPAKRGNYRKFHPRKFNRRYVSIKTHEAPGTIIIDTNKKFLFYVTSKNKAIRYGIGVGREGFGWNGIVTVRAKKEWPLWTPPEKMRQREKAKGRILPKTVKGGLKNPLGARAMYLYKNNRDTLYRIHGTNQPWTIGRNISSGCIRLINKDVEDLYEKVTIGTKVIVIGQNENSAKIYKTIKNPFLALFGDIF